MTDLLYARAQMGLSLAFHIVFAAAGVALPVLMVLSDLKARRTEAIFLGIYLYGRERVSPGMHLFSG